MSRMPKFLSNRFRGDPLAASVPAAAVRRYHRSLADYRPTPLHSLPFLASELGVGAVYLKDEGPRFGLGAFKSLGASWALHRLLESGLTTDVVSTASAGNHGRAVAWAARRHGIQAFVFLPAATEPARIAAVRSEGADVVLVKGSYEDAVESCARRSGEAGWLVVADVGYPGHESIPLLVAEGYSTLLQEIDETIALRSMPPPDLVLVQGGVGCLASAVVSHFARVSPRPRIVVVEPAEADCLMASAGSLKGTVEDSAGTRQTIMGGLNCRRASTTAWPVIRASADGFLTITDEAGREAMTRLARGRGGEPQISSGPSGAAGLAGLTTLCRDPALDGARRQLGLGSRTTALIINTERQPLP